MNAQSAYEDLIRRAREQAVLATCADVLAWDEETYMPSGGVAHRSDQLAWLTTEAHTRATDPAIRDLLDSVEGSPLVSDATSDTAVNVREIRRQFDRDTRMPLALAEELARATTLAQQAWVVARAANDYAGFCPWLERIVALRRAEADAVGFVDQPYDALLDEYEPGTTTRSLTALFDAIRDELVPLVGAVTESPRQPRHAAFRSPYPVELQRAVATDIATAMGFDFSAGRLDTSAHPFAIVIGPGDCRLTIRYDARDITESLFGLLHEAGHGLYDQGLDSTTFGTPLGDAASQGLHESQARLWENRVGRSRAFWQYALPVLQARHQGALTDLSVDDAYFAANAVARSVNRVRADELTYNLHIMVRFELERDLMAGTLTVRDLPEAWNTLYRQYLGVTPPNDAEGCLQDSHWAAGLIGYFPTYTLGDVYAAQLFAAAQQAIGDLPSDVSRGDFVALRDWLRVHVHQQGHRYSASEIVERATGRPPAAATLMTLLREKYSDLYGL